MNVSKNAFSCQAGSVDVIGIPKQLGAVTPKAVAIKAHWYCHCSMALHASTKNEKISISFLTRFPVSWLGDCGPFTQ